MSEVPPPQANPVGQMLGHQWGVSPVAWAWQKANGPEGPFHLLLVETMVGRVGFAFTADDLDGFLRAGREQLTGLVLPKPGEVVL